MSSTTAIMSERRTALLGAGLVAIGPVSMALYTPAMPTLVAEFGTTDSAVKLTLTSYLAGFALAQLICGPLTDAFGRKPMALVFLLLYLVSTLLAAFSPTISFIVMARALQGIGASIGITVARAIIRDQFTDQTSARIMNSVAMMLAIGPAISPTIGGIVLEAFGWQETFWCMLIYGGVLLVSVALFQKETNRYMGRSHLKPRQISSNYASLLKDKTFLAPSLLVASGMGQLYAFTTVLPFIMIQQVALSPSEFGMSMILQSGSFIIGTIVTGRLLKVRRAAEIAPYGMVLQLLASILMCFCSLALEPTIYTVMLPVGLSVFALSFLLPYGFTTAMEDFPHIAGSASAMIGFLQFGSGIAASLIIAALGDPLLGLGVILAGMPPIGIVLYLIIRKQKKPQTIVP